MRTGLMFALLPAFCFAQEHPFIGVYGLAEVDNGVRVKWSITGGNTCDGQAVERSLDGMNFSTLHSISGLCGSPSEEVSYGWLDETPPELQRVYYRIRIGYEDFSSIKAIDITGLVQSEQLVYPSPAQEQLTLLLNVPDQATMTLRLFSETGTLVRLYETIPAQRTVLDLVGLQPGVYFYTAELETRSFTGRFVRL